MSNEISFKNLLTGFLKPKKAQPVEPVAPAPPPPIPAPAPNPKPRSEAYLNRRKGRRSDINYERLIGEYLVAKGEAAPAEMLRDLNIPKSTLIHNLNRLLTLSQMDPTVWHRRISEQGHVTRVLGGKRLERVGGSKHVKYKLVEHPQKMPDQSESRQSH